jgi:hypothetical protein
LNCEQTAQVFSKVLDEDIGQATSGQPCFSGGMPNAQTRLHKAKYSDSVARLAEVKPARG